MPGLLGLVTVLYNSDGVLEGFFQGLYRQRYPHWRLYIVDNSVNATTDALLTELSERFPLPYVEHIKSPGNIGVAAGNNAGIRRALEDGCSHIVLLNNDIEMDQDFLLDELVRLTVEEGKEMVAPKVLFSDTRRLWMAGGFISKWKALGVHEGYNQPDGPAFNKGKYIGYAPTCFLLVSRRVLEKTGLMDEAYFAYYDDVDFVWRAQKAGFRLWYEPSLVILHKVSYSSGGGESPFYVYYSNRNKIYFVRKNFRGLFRIIPLVHLLLTRIFYWLRFDAVKRKKLEQGLRDGFKMRAP